MNPVINLTQASENLGHYLLKNQAQIVTAESCTGGWLAQCITDIAGSSAWFDRGFITYSNQAKIDMLGVNPETLAQFGAVSAQVATQMVSGALRHSAADYAIAITGIAGPTGGSIEKPVGSVYIAWQKKHHLAKVALAHFNGNREQIRKQAVYQALNLIPNE
ncbi:MAG: CinA family protein [Methyloprofundus sp.]|nr:CinA family protein [Methyloprofundus sp.]MDT8425180.1 CinA family protein [Methyloprofundus sp.]